MLAKAKRLLPIFLTLVILLSLGGCSAGEVEVKIAGEQLMGSITAAAEDIETCQIDMEVLMSVSGESEGETVGMSISYDSSSVVDNVNKKMRMMISMEMEMQEGTGWQSESMEMEIYLIGDTMYMMISEPGMPEEWRQQTTPDLWDQQNQVEQQLELLETAEIDIISSERVNGVDCYKVKLVPNLGKLYEIAMQNPASDELLGEIPLDIFDMEEMFKSYSATQWYAEDTYFPVKAVMEMTMGISSEEIGLPGMDFEIEMDTEMVINYRDYGEPVSIELPPETV